MSFNESKITECWRSLLIMALSAFCLSSLLQAQPTIDPAQTVNPATGEMSFSLPLGEVKGVNGKNFSVNLNYGAGIPSLQPASNCGLGFSLEPGLIVKKKVMIADNNLGNTGGVDRYNYNDIDQRCWAETWRQVLNAIVMVVALICAIIAGACSGGTGFVAVIGVVANVVSLAASVGSMVVQLVITSPSNYNAGGSHLPSYDYKFSDGKGYFCGGEKEDLPDLYFVNTPFFSGEIIPTGDPTKHTGVPQVVNFVSKVSHGSTKENKETVKIRYNVETNKFRITLADGTILLFEKANRAPNYQSISGHKQNNDGSGCWWNIEINTKEPETMMWHLTAVLYGDYIDGSVPMDTDPLNSVTNNKGSWFAMEYDSLIGHFWLFDILNSESKRVSTTSRAISSIGGGEITNINELTYFYILKSIVSPVDKAIFSQSLDRDDMIWDGSGKFNSTDTSDIGFPRLVSIEFGMDGNRRQKIGFDQTNAFREHFTLGGTVKSLALNSIRYYKQTLFGWGDAWVVNFNYVPLNPRIDYHDSFTSLFYHSDYWGYHYNNDSSYSGYNACGLKERTIAGSYPWAASWSLESVVLPSGNRIKWEYEGNRYDRANNIPVASVIGEPRYGGGIRVKKVGAFDYVSKKNKSWSYFYTDSTSGYFTETSTNSSGHATVEPNPYLLETVDDPRPRDARGGYYTAAKVMYETVTIAEDFNNGVAPNGYTVQEFTSPADYPNLGLYGMVDQGWKRGYLKKKRVYNSSNRLILQEEREYDFVEQARNLPIEVFNQSPNYSTLRENTYGWVRLKKAESINLGVKTGSVSKYAADLSVPTPDYVLTAAKRIDKAEAWEEIYQMPRGGWNSGSGNNLVAAFTRTKRFGNRDSTDYLVAALSSGNTSEWNVNMYLGIDLPSVNPPAGTPRPQWLESGGIVTQLGGIYRNILGLGVTNFSPDTSNNDVLLFVGPANEALTSSTRIWKNDFKCIIFKDVCDNGRGAVELPDTGRIEIEFNNQGYPVDNAKTLVSCAVGDINGNAIPDVVLLEGRVEDPGASDVPRRLFGFMDITTSTSFSAGNDTVCCISAPFSFLKGEQISFVDYDSSGGANDLEITGQAHTGSGHTEPNYPIHRTVLCNVVMNMVTKELTADSLIQLPDYFYLGERTDIRQFYYIGMSQMNNAEDPRDRKVFSVYYPNYYDTISQRPRLSIINLYPEVANADYDGQPNRTWARNSDGTYLLSTSTQAYWKYPLMGDPDSLNNKHMLAQQCGTVTYRFPSGTSETVFKGALSGEAGNVVAATATTWAEFNSTWLPKANYAWRVPMDTAGLPVTFGSYVPFSYSSFSANVTSWGLTDSICKYSPNSLPIEVAMPTSTGNRTYSSSIFGYGGTLPIAKVTNSHWAECGVFTCDYDMNDAGFFDKENLWIHHDSALLSGAICTVTTTYPHFGQKNLHVKNSKAAARKVAVYSRAAKITRSAWVRPVNTNPIRFAACLVVNGVGNRNFVYDYVYDVAKGLRADGSWQLVNFTIDISRPEGLAPLPSEFNGVGDDGIYTWIGNRTGDAAADFYIDDIRIAPVKAFVTSTYYDQLWQQPIISIDANNNPGKRVTFDGFGRPIQWDKVDPTRSVGDAGYAKTLQRKTYHLRNELLTGKRIQLNSPTENDDYTSVASVPIRWVNDSTRNIDIYYKLKSGSTWPTIWTRLNAMFNQSGSCTYDWPVPANTANFCRIKVEIVEGVNNVIERDSTVGEFYVSSPFVLPSGWAPTAWRETADLPNEVHFWCPCVNGAVSYKLIIESPPSERIISCCIDERFDVGSTIGSNYSIFIYDRAGNRLKKTDYYESTTQAVSSPPVLSCP